MTDYMLSRLAPGSYDVILRGEIIASAVRTGPIDAPTWTVELLQDLPPGKRPPPFTQVEHEFGTFGAVRRWLGISGAEIEDPEGGSTL